MRSFNKPGVLELMERNYTKSAAAKRLGVSTKVLDEKCKKASGLTWDEFKAQERDKRNKELSKKPVGAVYYYGAKRTMYVLK